MIVPLSFLSGIGNSSSLRWLKRTLKTDPWTNIGGTVNGSNLESNVAFSSFSEFAIGSIDSTNFVSVLTLTAMIQGLYNGSTMISDTVTVELHNAGFPYTLIDSKKGVLNTAGVGTFAFTNPVNGIPYYLVIKHRNSIETWSAITPSFTSGALNYDFTIAASQAYGSNMVLKSGKYCIYSGDVNQDGIVDSGDLGLIDNDYSNYLIGYLVTDVNGDGLVDSGDMSQCDNNYSLYIHVAKPTSLPIVESIIHEVKFEKRRIK
jgi:hypothetical protein